MNIIETSKQIKSNVFPFIQNCVIDHNFYSHFILLTLTLDHFKVYVSFKDCQNIIKLFQIYAFSSVTVIRESES